jgi:UDP-N-acetylmuramate: L-alanyl-gamma-D-glutamyl-meso-diaminopimelate ligase
MFKRLTQLVPSKGKIIYYQGSKNLQELTKEISFTQKEAYQINTKNSYFSIKSGEYIFTKSKKRISSTMIGSHNLKNIELVYRICKEIGLNESEIIKNIESFPGVKRRQDILYQDNKSIIIEDFAHHPVAIQETILAIKSKYPEYELISLFEPRSATSHRNIFQNEFAKSFKGSNFAFITEVYNLNKVSKKDRLNVKKLVSDTKLKSKVKKAIYAINPDDLLQKLAKEIIGFKTKKICILAMSNGSFGGIYPKLISMVKSR